MPMAAALFGFAGALPFAYFAASLWLPPPFPSVPFAFGGGLIYGAVILSFLGGIRWGTGMSRAFQYERTQSRIGAPPWDAPLQFIENSPIFWVEKVETPYLTIHNDEDDAVPWYQGIEFITALRRLGKEGYMFNYNGERHGLRNRDNMKHFTVHMDEFFDHYLLGRPRPEWMDKGVPYLERGTRDVSPLFKKKVTSTTPTSQVSR